MIASGLFLIMGLLSPAYSTTSYDVFNSTTWEESLQWCHAYSGQIFIGDFNGDGRQDMLCHSYSTGEKWLYYARCDGTFDGDTWYRNMGWCFNWNGVQLHLGDFNGDGRTDILCHDTQGPTKWVALAQPGGTFLGTYWHAVFDWCNYSGAQLFIDDFNADGRSDMLCHDDTGHIRILYANKDGSFPEETSWELAMGFCAGSSGSQLFTGDFNGDRRADLLCHDSIGCTWVALASSDGIFSVTWWHAALDWCHHSTAKLYIGDFNKDRRADMLCSDGDGNKWVAFSTPDGEFTGASWEEDMGWCNTGTQMFVADVNGDGGDDLLCHRPSDAYKWVALNTYP